MQHGAETLLATYVTPGLTVGNVAELEHDGQNVESFTIGSSALARAEVLLRVSMEQKKLLHGLVLAVLPASDSGVTTRGATSPAQVMVAGASNEAKEALISYSIAWQGMNIVLIVKL